jgi:2-polyprenyl-3-methyl-5-hydroxy-6-metoxy-1,4-benzoquinol methylase
MKFTLKSYPCSVCGSSNCGKLYDVKGFAIVQCKDCGFVFVNPRIENSDLQKIYADHYFTNTGEGYGYQNYELTSHLRVKTFEKWISEIEPFLSKSNGPVLDVGCASGYFLELMRSKGWEVEGIELDREMVVKLKEKQLKVSDRPFEEFVSAKKYKLITLFDVLEHLPDLKSTFTKLSDLLDEDGIVALITPDFSSTQRKLFGKKWFQYKPQEHIQYFTPKTLAKAIEPYGLKLVHASPSGQYADTGFLLDRLNRYGFNFFRVAAGVVAGLFGLKNKFWYLDTGSLFAVIKKK